MKNTVSKDRDGNLSIDGTFNFNGSLFELKKIIENTIKEYGEETQCTIKPFWTKYGNWSNAQIILNINK